MKICHVRFSHPRNCSCSLLIFFFHRSRHFKKPSLSMKKLDQQSAGAVAFWQWMPMLGLFRHCGGRLSRKRRITNYSCISILFHRVPTTDVKDSVIRSNVGKQKLGYNVHIQLIHRNRCLLWYDDESVVVLSGNLLLSPFFISQAIRIVELQE